MKPICYVPDDSGEARAILDALARQGIHVRTTEPSFLGRGRFWVDDEHYSGARELIERIAAGAASRRTRKLSAGRASAQVKPRWLAGGFWLAAATIALMLAVFLGFPLLAALGLMR